MPTISADSLQCIHATPSLRKLSSRDLGWQSVLVDIHDGMLWETDYAAVTTADLRIGLSLAGTYATHFRSRGVSRRDVFCPGTTTVMRSDADRTFRFSRMSDNTCRFALIYIPHEELKRAADELTRGQRTPEFTQLMIRDPALTQVAHGVVQAMQSHAADFYAQSASAWIAAHLIWRQAGEDAGDKTATTFLSDGRLARVIDFMAAHFADPITLDQLANVAGISKYHFVRLFRERVGQTPLRHLSDLRLAAASRMLVTTGLRIGEIAMNCGYSSASVFATAFKARHGLSAAQYRARYGSGRD